MTGLATNNKLTWAREWLQKILKWYPLCAVTRPLLGVITRWMSWKNESFSGFSTLQNTQKLSYHHDEVIITDELYAWEKWCPLGKWCPFAEILTHMTQDLVVNSGRNLIIEWCWFISHGCSMMFYVSALNYSYLIRDGRLLLIMTFISIIKICIKSKCYCKN